MADPIPSSPGLALVTGASSGIGATYADRLARRGHDLLLVARNTARLDTLATRLREETGVAVEVLSADLTVRDDVLRLERRIRDDMALTLLVNNAGLGPQGPALGADLDYIDTLVALNVAAVNRLTLAAADAFAARGSGTIINIASVVAIIPPMFQAPYSASKAFVLALTQALNTEVAPRGVRLQAVCPGLTRTEIFERAGVSMEHFDPAMVMDVGDMVDAALAGLDQGELVTIPSLPDPADWDRLLAAQMALGPNLSRNTPAARFRTA